MKRNNSPLRLSKIEEETVEEIFDGPLPLHSFDLIEVLDKAFPERYKRPGENIEQHMFDGGCRGLINYMKAWRDAQEQDDDDENEEDSTSSPRIVTPREAPELPRGYREGDD